MECRVSLPVVAMRLWEGVCVKLRYVAHLLRPHFSVHFWLMLILHGIIKAKKARCIGKYINEVIWV